MHMHTVERVSTWLKTGGRVWLFPLIMLVLLVTLTLGKISGSSVGVYPMLDGTAESDGAAILFNPRGVRSDEWLVNTQLTVAQAANDFKRINNNIGTGQDVSIIADVPYKEWSAIFKPQNLAFFALPLEYAFAFKWWLLLVLLVLACYFLILELLPGKILLSALLGLIAGFNPMVFWWYQTSTILTIAYGLLIMLLLIRLVKATSTRTRTGYSMLLAYVLTCFLLILYPPFQIPCLLVVIVFLVGWALDFFKGDKAGLLQIFKLWPYALLIGLLVSVAAASFFYTRRDAINTIMHTDYPGTRVILSGGTNPLQVFSSHLSPNLQYDEKAASGYLRNQSEASNFIFIAPYLFLPSLLLTLWHRKKHKTIPWGLVLINALIALFLFRMFVSAPWLEPAYRLLLLDKVPNPRLLIGLGLAGIIQLTFCIRVIDSMQLQPKKVRILALTGGALGLIAMVLTGFYTIEHYPVFIASYAKVIVFSLWVALGVFLILFRQFTFGLVVLLAFSLLSVHKVHPLYRGLGPLTDAPIIQKLASYPTAGNWAVLDDRLTINFPIMAGKPSLSGVYLYPQFDLWGQLDPERSFSFMYNRYAHVLFSSEPIDEPFTLPHADLLLVTFDSCGKFAQRNIRYALAAQEVNQPCLNLRDTVETPAKNYHIYEIVAR